MEHCESVSKGFFVYKPGKFSDKSKKRSKKKYLDPVSEFQNSSWYSGYHSIWDKIENELQTIGDDVMKVLLNDIGRYIQETPKDTNLIPTVLLLTGVNLPDHGSMFDRLKNELVTEATSLVAMVSSIDCLNLKQTIEQIVSQFINKSERNAKVNKTPKKKSSLSRNRKGIDSSEDSEEGSDEDEELMEVDSETEDSKIIKRSDCTMPYLSSWYADTWRPSFSKENSKLVIVFKDFEGFQPQLLHNLILILSGYLSRLPIVLVFGVATTEAAIGEYLTHQITSKLTLKVFQSQPSVYFLNNTLDKVFLTPNCPFQLSGKLLKFFTDVFLFYDFSVHHFTQGIKYCVMDHFFENDLVGLLCQEEKVVRNKLKSVKIDELNGIKSIPSVKKYLESLKNSNCDMEKNFTKEEVMSIVSTLRNKISDFYASLRVLHALVKNLPQTPLGKQFRELYCIAMTKEISETPEYKESQQFLNFTSKDELEEKISEIQRIISQSDSPRLKEVKNTINEFKLELGMVGLKPNTRSPVKSPMKIDLNVKNRSQLKKKLAEIGSRSQIKVGFEALREKIVNFFMRDFLPNGLVPYVDQTPLWEIILVSDIDARNRVVPRIRAPIHTALNNPHHYLQCKCCEIDDEHSILPTMPDICIAYKLHLESGPLINIYDWLQSFSMIVDSNTEKKNIEDVDEKVQARFTQALAELEFLGFIKSSKRKPDHVSRLTWGST